MKTFSLKSSQVVRQWYLLDASSTTLGRLSTRSASLLLGKGKVGFTPHVDNGDFVIIINAKNLRTTGDKSQKKTYYRHSGYPGGLRKRTLDEQMEFNPARIIEHSIRGMLPDNKLRPQRLLRLKVYVKDEHPHDAQQPKIIDLTQKGAK